jgi:hypothetical protein
MENEDRPLSEELEGRPLKQTLALVALIEYLHEKNREVENWHLCKNGCCFQFHVLGFDESVWVVSSDGEIENLDRYGNVIESVPTWMEPD